MKDSPLKQLESLGQSIWLDHIKRSLLTNGELRRMINEDGLRGMTSNPAFFENTIAESHDYNEDLRSMALEGMDAKAIYETLSQRDVQVAADEFKSVYEITEGQDGYVSLEVDPHLAHDSHGTIEEARRLWAALDRPNVLIKIPATIEGLSAIQQLIGEGINVNATLLFGLPRYQDVAEAYIAGIEMWQAKGGSVRQVASVASFYLSRIDAMVDPMLEKTMTPGGYKAELARQAHGRVAVAIAIRAYQIHKKMFNSGRFGKLAKSGARPQRLLWVITSNKNPDYGDVKYVESLIGLDTVNAVPLKTLNDFRSNGVSKALLDNDVESAAMVLECLAELGINIDAIAQRLGDEGIEKFTKLFDKMLETLAKAATGHLTGKA